MKNNELAACQALLHDAQSAIRGKDKEIARLVASNCYAAAPSSSPSPVSVGGLSQELREYAGNPGYSHGDYADVMRRAADEIDRRATTSEPVGAAEPVYKSINSIAENHDAMIILMGDFTREQKIRVVDANIKRQVAAALAEWCAATQEPVGADAGARERFEVLVRSECGMTDESLERMGDQYQWGRTADMWWAWRHALASQAAQPAPTSASEREKALEEVLILIAITTTDPHTAELAKDNMGSAPANAELRSSAVRSEAEYWLDKAVGGFYLSKESVPESAWKRGGMVGLVKAATPTATKAVSSDAGEWWPSKRRVIATSTPTATDSGQVRADAQQPGGV